MEKYAKYSVEDFVNDSGFIAWVINPDNESNKFWAEVIHKFPGQTPQINEAVFLVQSLQAVEEPVTKEKTNSLWAIITSKKDLLTTPKRFNYLRWAALIILLIGIGSVITKQFTPDFEVAETPINDVEEAQIILSDGSTKSINKKESEIEVKTNGEILVDNETLASVQENVSKTELTHVVMPYGKQTKLQLPDGSTVHLNSGSKLSFPVQFSDSKREVYLLGEAFLKVEEDNKPFIVHTPEMDIYVTGTEFNVSAYSDDNFVQTVLVEGKVSVRRNGLFAKKIEVEPGESALFNKESGQLITEMVETDQYTSWINGYIICSNETVSGVTKKLERYYNCKISIETTGPEITFSGKLDLHEDVAKVLETISYASLLKLEQNKNEFTLKQ